MILILGSLKNNSSLVATLATLGYPFYRHNSKMAAKWRHTVWMFLCIHKRLSVIHVTEGFRGHIIHFYWYYVHLTSLEPIFWSSEQDAQNKPRSPPPPNHFHRAKWLCDATKWTRSLHFRSFWCILQSPSLQKILQEAQVCFKSV